MVFSDPLVQSLIRAGKRMVSIHPCCHSDDCRFILDEGSTFQKKYSYVLHPEYMDHYCLVRLEVWSKLFHKSIGAQLSRFRIWVGMFHCLAV